MPLQIIRQDITQMAVDAIVNAANSSLMGGGGVDGCIHRAAGPELLKECETLGGCETGNAKITGAYNLPCKYVIHTVGPRYVNGCLGERELLEDCYRNSLILAKENNCETVAFPLISSGIYGYPKDEALKVATDAISEFLLENEMMVYLVIFDRSSFEIGEKLFKDISTFIDEHYVAEYERLYPETERPMCSRTAAPRMMSQSPAMSGEMSPRFEAPKSAPPLSAAPCRVSMAEEKDVGKTKKLRDLFKNKKAKKKTETPDISTVNTEVVTNSNSMPTEQSPANPFFSGMWSDESYGNRSLEEVLGQIDESFSEMLLRKIDERGMKDSECYKKANIDRKLFSKIRSDANYRPSKPTVIAFAIALELSLDDTKDMLMKAGFALSHSNKFDLIIEFFISKGIYDVFEINEALFAFDQSLLGA